MEFIAGTISRLFALFKGAFLPQTAALPLQVVSNRQKTAFFLLPETRVFSLAGSLFK